MILGRHTSIVDQVMDTKLVGLKILAKLINARVLRHIEGDGFWLFCIFKNFLELRSGGGVSASCQNPKPFIAQNLDKTQPDPSKINQSEASVQVT